MLNLIDRIKAAWHITQHPPEQPSEISLYPMVLKQGTITYMVCGMEEPAQAFNTTAIINEDLSITLITAGDITGWIQPGDCWTIISE